MFSNLKKINNIISRNSINLEKVFSVRIWIYKNKDLKDKKKLQKILNF
jgi:hypothetical protein